MFFLLGLDFHHPSRTLHHAQQWRPLFSLLVQGTSYELPRMHALLKKPRAG